MTEQTVKFSIISYNFNSNLNISDVILEQNPIKTKKLNLIVYPTYESNLLVLIVEILGKTYTLSSILIDGHKRNKSIRFFDSTGLKIPNRQKINKSFVVACIKFFRTANLSFVSKPSENLIFTTKMDTEILNSYKLANYWEDLFKNIACKDKIIYNKNSNTKNIKKLKQVEIFDDRIELSTLKYMSYSKEIKTDNTIIFKTDLIRFYQSMNCRRDFNESTIFYYLGIKNIDADNKFVENISENEPVFCKEALNFIRELNFSNTERNFESTQKIIEKFTETTKKTLKFSEILQKDLKSKKEEVEFIEI